MIPNLSDKPDKWVLVSCIAASSPFSPCGIWLSSHLVSNDAVFSSYPGFLSLGVFMQDLFKSGSSSI